MAHLTEAAIQDALLRLLSEQPFDKITVTQLVDECQITRRTFYYHYSDLYELLDTIQMIANIMNGMQEDFAYDR